MEKKEIIKCIVEGIALSLINLALIAIYNTRYEDGFVIGNSNEFGSDSPKYVWYTILIIFSFIVAFLTVKIKKLGKNKGKWLIGIYTFIPPIVDLCLRDGYIIYFSSLKWVFILITVTWFILRYEIDEIIK